ncbi:MAG: formimidoylglutamate deiminase [Beijerinckiaceae bacterium]
MTASTFLFEHAYLPEGWQRNVVVRLQNGIITSVGGPSDGAIRVKGAALPGLPNLHSHTFQRGMAGLAERRGPSGDSFWTWREVMYRFLDKLTPDAVEAIAAMAMVEMLEAGFTSLAEFHYLHHAPDGRPYADIAELAGRIVAAAGETGIGLTLLPVFYAHGGFGGQPAQPGQRRFISADIDAYRALRDAAGKAIRGLAGAVLGAAPHSLRAVTPEQLSAFQNAVPDGPIHIHIAEQMREVHDCLAWCGERPVQWLLNHAPVDQRWCLIHATHMLPEEIAGVVRSGAVAGLCPITEANLGDGVFAGVDFTRQGGLYGVGSDSNVEISASGELRLFEYSQRLWHRGRNMLAERQGASTGEALYRAALAGGAQALAQPVGAIAAGKRADFVVLDTDHAAFVCGGPAHWLDAYLFNAGNRAIDRVMVGGVTLVEGGYHLKRQAVAARFAQCMAKLA